MSCEELDQLGGVRADSVEAWPRKPDAKGNRTGWRQNPHLPNVERDVLAAFTPFLSLILQCA